MQPLPFKAIPCLCLYMLWSTAQRRRDILPNHNLGIHEKTGFLDVSRLITVNIPNILVLFVDLAKFFRGKCGGTRMCFFRITKISKVYDELRPMSFPHRERATFILFLLFC